MAFAASAVPFVDGAASRVSALTLRQTLCEDLHDCGSTFLSADGLSDLSDCHSDSLLALGAHWHDLPVDNHLIDGGRYRQRRYASLTQELGGAVALPASGAGGPCVPAGTHGIQMVPHRRHWQPVSYNAIHGGIERWFSPIDSVLTQSTTWLRLVAALGGLFGRIRFPTHARWFIEAHQFRVTTHDGQGLPTPEGLHRDGVDFVAIVLIDRRRVAGGVTTVRADDGTSERKLTLHEPWSALLLDDQRVRHETSAIVRAAPGTESEYGVGWRDTLVLTYRAGGFQDPDCAEPGPR